MKIKIEYKTVIVLCAFIVAMFTVYLFFHSGKDVSVKKGGGIEVSVK